MCVYIYIYIIDVFADFEISASGSDQLPEAPAPAIITRE